MGGSRRGGGAAAGGFRWAANSRGIGELCVVAAGVGGEGREAGEALGGRRGDAGDADGGEVVFGDEVVPAETGGEEGLELVAQGLGGVAIDEHEAGADGKGVGAFEDHRMLARAGTIAGVEKLGGGNLCEGGMEGGGHGWRKRGTLQNDRMTERQS